MDSKNYKSAIVPHVPQLCSQVKNYGPEKSDNNDFLSLAINQQHGKQPEISMQVSVLCGHDRQNLGLIFLVEEPNVLGTKLKDFENVYEDSCVEFFFQLKEHEYWNFELNCLGSCLCARGRNRENRKFLNPDILASVYRSSSLEKKTINIINQKTQWCLKLILPLGKWLKKPLQKNFIRGNFYKCGDRLLNPHYLSWNKVATPKPDFHRPEYFGKLIFE